MSQIADFNKTVKFVGAVFISSLLLTACNNDNKNSADNSPHQGEKKPVMDCAPK